MHVLQTNMNWKNIIEVYWVTHFGGGKKIFVLFSHLLLVFLFSFLISDIVLKSHSLSSASVLVTSLLYGQEREKKHLQVLGKYMCIPIHIMLIIIFPFDGFRTVRGTQRTI